MRKAKLSTVHVFYALSHGSFLWKEACIPGVLSVLFQVIIAVPWSLIFVGSEQCEAVPPRLRALLVRWNNLV